MTAPNEATARQLAAARPDRSTWLAANAGSGKTKVLTDRVTRLLLEGTPPQHILCLTYTKAAASEMQNRLFKRLGEWAMLDEPTLRDELTKLSPDSVLDDAVIRHARTLFARAIETPGGLKIQTIHSFCGGLLRRFPLEAGVSPQYRELDDRTSKDMLRDVLEDMSDGPDRYIIDAVALHLGEDIYGLGSDVLSNRDSFATPQSEEQIWSWFDLPDGFDEAALLGEVFLGGEQDMFAEMAELFSTSDKATDQKFGLLFGTLSTTPISTDFLNQCIGALLSKSGENAGLSNFGRRSGVATKDFRIANQEALEPLRLFMERVEQSAKLLSRLQDAKRTAILHRFAGALIPKYLAKKSYAGLLDFDDMIRKARDLLSNSETAQWVLFRLDGGIDHILVDEAQDTSPDQWIVVRRLAEEFASGQGARPDVKRTIFVVGDKKQSIYSFQGADPSGFDDMCDFFDDRLGNAGDPLQKLSLEHSFRSSPAILNATDAVFAASEGYGVGGKPQHIAFFDTMPGRVDVWPLIEQEKDDNGSEDWEDPLDLTSPMHHNHRLAELIANQISTLLESGALPDGENGFRAIEPKDILILVRRRSGLFLPLLSKLKEKYLPVAGADLLTVGNELAVRDLCALLSFLALEEDDLALAEALKSPLFNWTEQQLYSLAHDRKAANLWQELRARRNEFSETVKIIDDLRLKLDVLRPYDLLERILIKHDGRRKFLARLGPEAEDGIDALLGQARTYETTQTPSLTGFLAWFEEEDIKIKRVLDENSNLIRVMTTHGAKGLEAPIVILPDTLPNSKEKQVRGSIIKLDENRAVHLASAAAASDLTNEARTALLEKAEEERRRLLYVAMTRAEKWLIVAAAGAQPKNGTSWYELVMAGMEELGAEPLDHPLHGGLRYQVGEWGTRPDVSTTPNDEQTTLPHWAENETPTPPKARDFLSPSDLGGAKALGGEDAYLDGEQAKRRGRQIHLLLDALPPLPPSDWEHAARYVIPEGEDVILDEEISDLLDEVRRVIENSYDWDVFGSNSLSEVPFSSNFPTLGGQGVHGIIDRLIVEPDRVQIVDFKTNAIVPETVNRVPEGLLRQLGAYADAVERMYPDRTIQTALLWTRTAELMEIPRDIVRDALLRTTIS
ncbi:double-strand break repair helicase AddA [Celeribacter sp.]|uniref:double-strand break repair helicase AddA n=1 Tax=Celeribacter sp. TaxID=1890673 RepID=UPI003A8F74C7